MKNAIQRMAMAAVALAGVATTANAVPIRIDFTGTVFSSYRFDANGLATQDPSFMGQSVAGWFLIETEGLARVATSTTQYNQLAFNDVVGAPELVTSGLTIGGANYDVGLYDLDTGGIRYLDSKGPVSCGPMCSSTTPDQMSFSDASAQRILGPGAPFPGPGNYYGRSMTLGSTLWPDPVMPAPQNYIDLSQDLNALSSVLLPLQTSLYRGVTGSYGETTLACTATSCRQIQSLSLAWDIKSVSRRIVEASEPATWLLAALSVLGLLGARRRRAQ